jgi:hypothetical protein
VGWRIFGKKRCYRVGGKKGLSNGEIKLLDYAESGKEEGKVRIKLQKNPRHIPIPGNSSDSLGK